MEQYIPISLVILFISGLIAINKEVVKRPTFKEVEDKYTEIKLCKEIHKSVDEKLECLPETKDIVSRLETKVDILLKNNNK